MCGRYCLFNWRYTPGESHYESRFLSNQKIAQGITASTSEKIDVCPNGCMLYWASGDIKKDKCDKCGKKRYKTNKREGGKNKPRKVLIYFPIGPRLQRLYATKNVA